MEDYRNNFKVEKAIKTALYRDRARIQVGRISMFGLLELSRQRLRSSLIDRSFEKCPYCDGSGLILNTITICEQIIKVNKEKINNKDNLNIKVKCNSALAQTLINEKRLEIDNIENENKCKINFIFDNHYSLNEPTVESEKESQSKEIKIEKSKEIKRIKKKIVKKKTNAKRTIKIRKKAKVEIKEEEKDQTKEGAKEENSDENSDENKIKKIDKNIKKKKTIKKSKKRKIKNKETKIDAPKEEKDEISDKSGWWKE